MSFRINAWIEYNQPRLAIVKAQSGVVLHQWRLTRIEDSPQQRQIVQVIRPGIQQLVKELFLISCVEEITNMQSNQHGDLGDICLYCDKCLEKTGMNNIVYLDLVKRSIR